MLFVLGCSVLQGVTSEEENMMENYWTDNTAKLTSAVRRVFYDLQRLYFSEYRDTE